MNLKEIKDMMELMRQMGVSELEVERSGVKIRIKTGRTLSEELLAAPVRQVVVHDDHGVQRGSHTTGFLKHVSRSKIFQFTANKRAALPRLDML